MKPIECRIRVRYNETGRQGYAHHSHFFNWFDIVLETLVSNCGMSYKDVEDMGYFFAPINDQIKYFHPAAYNDELTVRLTVRSLSSIKIKFKYEIIREKDAMLIAVGQTEHVLVDQYFRPHSLKKVLPKLYDLINDGE